MHNLAGLYNSQGKYEKAESMYVDCLEKSKAVLGDMHPDTLTSMSNLYVAVKVNTRTSY
jgi:hypothetical protein